MKKFLISLAVAVGLVGLTPQVYADDVLAYTINFGSAKPGSGTQASSSELSGWILTGLDDITSATISSVYSEGNDFVRIGASSSTGSINFSLSDAGQVNATKLVVKVASYGSDSNPGLKINNNTISVTSATATEYTITLDGSKLTSLNIETTTKSKGRVYLYSISVYTAEEGSDSGNTGGGETTEPTEPGEGGGDTPSEGDNYYSIIFDNNSSDASTDVTSNTLLSYITTGASYVKGATDISKVYKGTTGLKFGSSKAVGTITLNLNEVGQVNVEKIVVNAKGYAASGTTLSVNNVANALTSTELSEYTYSFDGEKLESISLATSGSEYRAYVKGITVYYTTEGEGGGDTPEIKPATPVISCTDNTVSITCVTEGADIYYTTDNENPTASSTPYTAEFTINQTVTVKAVAIKDGVSSDVASQECVYVAPSTPDPDDPEDEYVLLTNIDDLGDLADCIIVGSKDNVYSALSTTQQSNNRKAVNVTLKDGSIIPNDEVAIITISKISNSESYSLYINNGDNKGYLYGGLSGNYLRTTSTITDQAYQATISISNNDASIAFNVTDDSANTIRFNSSNNPQVFSCYKPANINNQQPVQIYIKASDLVVSNVERPVIECEDNLVTITCSTPEAKIYYTLDGETPDNNSTPYSEAFSIEKNTTVKAIAELNGEYSKVATFEALYYGTFKNYAEYVAANPTTGGKVDGPITAIYQNGQNLYTKDNNGGYMLIYGNVGTTLQNGNIISYVAGNYSPYNGLPEITSPTLGEVTTGDPVNPEVVAINEINATKANYYIKIEGVKINGTNLTNGSNSIGFYNKFAIPNVPTDSDKTYSVVGFVNVYNEKIEVYPVSFEVTSVDVTFNFVAEDNDKEDMSDFVKVTYGDNETVEGTVAVNPGKVFTLTPETGYTITEIAENDNVTIGIASEAGKAWTVTVNDGTEGKTINLEVIVAKIPAPTYDVTFTFTAAENAEISEPWTLVKMTANEEDQTLTSEPLKYTYSEETVFTFEASNINYTLEVTVGEYTMEEFNETEIGNIEIGSNGEWILTLNPGTDNLEVNVTVAPYVPESITINGMTDSEGKDIVLTKSAEGVYTATAYVAQPEGDIYFNLNCGEGIYYGYSSDMESFGRIALGGAPIELNIEECNENAGQWTLEDWIGGTIMFTVNWEEKTLTLKHLEGTSGIYGLGVDGEAVIYNLQGARVANPAKGIYIVNGKKVIIK